MSVLYFIPLLIVIIANLLYHNVMKNTPNDVNAFLSMAITYFVGVITSVALYFVMGRANHIIKDLQNLNWTSYVLGIAIVGVEIGYIYMYRVGWEISKGSLVASVAIAVLLIVMGMLFYKEAMSIKHLIGMGFCVVGLMLINSK